MRWIEEEIPCMCSSGCPLTLRHLRQIHDDDIFKTEPRGSVVEKPDLPFPKDVPDGTLWENPDKFEDYWVLDNYGDWCPVVKGVDTYRGKMLVELPPPELPLNQQYVGGLRLVRGWTISDGRLKALANNHYWTKDTQKCDETPRLGKHSGFYGFHDWGHAEHELAYHQGCIWGTYVAWGRCVRGKMGFRTQFAKIDSLIIPPGTPADDSNLATYQKLADDYGVPLLEYKTAKKLLLGVIPFREDMM